MILSQEDCPYCLSGFELQILNGMWINKCVNIHYNFFVYRQRRGLAKVRVT